ncbi:unnamed protein product [Rotaria sordida]|uniref:GH16 domain-containing protein n=1 Tax=Rotaria sordida TaxID=392033 RepID=A0A814ITT8_9BILA|nr:unnamed protein product [Rotaria sordida]
MINILSTWTLLGFIAVNILFLDRVKCIINWNGNNWAMSCDFRGNDLSNIRTSGELCGEKCAQTQQCTHFTWTQYNGGTCWMKSGTISKSDAFSTNDQTMVCGVINSGQQDTIQWNGNNWAMSCDFRGNDLSNVRISGELCGEKCAQTQQCTHFTWTQYNGGTCWMKSGTISKSDAFPTNDPTTMCGVVGVRDDTEWVRVWEDNFNWNGGVDPNKWDFDVGGNGWGNGEQQYYTNNRLENARCELFPSSTNGRLIVEARRENMANSQFTSARLKSKGKWTYGRLQIRAKLPDGRGLWPALWMLPEKQTYSNTYWPDNGEIDLMEQVGYDPLSIHATVHTQAYNHMRGNQPTNTVTVNDAVSNFKIYTLDWNVDKIEMFVGDDANPFAKSILVWKKEGDWTQWPFDKPFFVLINIAVGGSW